MKKEYAQKFNVLLQHFHFNKEMAGYSEQVSLGILHEGVSHLLKLSIFLGDSDARTLSEINNALCAIGDGEVPMPQEIRTSGEPLPEQASNKWACQTLIVVPADSFSGIFVYSEARP